MVNSERRCSSRELNKDPATYVLEETQVPILYPRGSTATVILCMIRAQPCLSSLGMMFSHAFTHRALAYTW